MELRRRFARNLHRLRTEKGLSQEQLALQAGIDRTYVSALEREIYSVSLDTIEKLARILGVDSSELLEKSRKMGRH